MKTSRVDRGCEVVQGEWVAFKGGELEGKRPKALCPACRARLQQTVGAKASRGDRPSQPPALCFACYRADLDRQRALKAAAELNTASEARFQEALPFEPVNRARLAQLRAARQAARVVASSGAGQYVDRRRRAQIEARHALQRVVAGLRDRQNKSEAARQWLDATHAAELQLPDAWLPFVVAR